VACFDSFALDANFGLASIIVFRWADLLEASCFEALLAAFGLLLCSN
jgi:hypothetical protein